MSKRKPSPPQTDNMPDIGELMSPGKKSVKPTRRNNATAQKRGDVMNNKPGKDRLSLYIDPDVSLDLDMAHIKIKRLTTRGRDLSKSALVERAIIGMLADFEENGADSWVVKSFR